MGLTAIVKLKDRGPIMEHSFKYQIGSFIGEGGRVVGRFNERPVLCYKNEGMERQVHVSWQTLQYCMNTGNPVIIVT